MSCDLILTNDLMPDVPLFVNADGLSCGRNSLTLFIMAVLDSELFSSALASAMNCLSNTARRAPVLDDSIIGFKQRRKALVLDEILVSSYHIAPI